jgi:hypothetical protein
MLDEIVSGADQPQHPPLVEPQTIYRILLTGGQWCGPFT